jgi:hypothetical protein
MIGEHEDAEILGEYRTREEAYLALAQYVLNQGSTHIINPRVYWVGWPDTPVTVETIQPECVCNIPDDSRDAWYDIGQEMERAKNSGKSY